MNYKTPLKSKTIIFNSLILIGSLVWAILQQLRYLPQDLTPYLGGASSLVNNILRFVTTQPIGNPDQDEVNNKVNL